MPKRVLVVDDERALKVFMKAFLEVAGHVCVLAGDGEEAVA